MGGLQYKPGQGQVLKVEMLADLNHQSHNIGFTVSLIAKINIMLSLCQATDSDSNISELLRSTSCLFQEKIRLDQIYFIALGGKFVPAARTVKT